MQHPEWPPLPGNMLLVPEFYMGPGKVGLRDEQVDYNLIAEVNKLSQALGGGTYSLEDEGPPGPPGGGGGTNSASGSHGFSYSSNDLYLTISMDNTPRGYASLVLHNTQSNYWYQIVSSTNLTNPLSGWALGQILQDTNGTNAITFDPVPIAPEPMTFYRAMEGTNVVTAVEGYPYAIEPDSGASYPGQEAYITLTLLNAPGSAMTVNYRMSGLAEYGVDYTNYPGTVSNSIGSIIIPSSFSSEFVFVHPLEDSLVEFEESVVLRLLPGSGYVINPDFAVRAISISDYDYQYPTNLFTVVTNILGPRGIDYDPLTTNLVVSYNWDNNGNPNNFGRIGLTNTGANLLATFAPWSVVSNVFFEVNLTVAKSNAAGFTKGDVYFSDWIIPDTYRGIIDKVAADGTNWTTGWCVLTNAQVPLPDVGVAGGLRFDETGLFGNELMAVTGWDFAESGQRGIWQVNSNGVSTLLALIDAEHLEDVLTLPDTTNWGPWAAKILTADKYSTNRLFYTVDTSGNVGSNASIEWFPGGISPEDFEVIPPDQDLFLCDPVFGDGAIMKFSRDWLTDYVGDLLVVSSGEVTPAALFIVHWDGEEFDVRRIPYFNPDLGEIPHFEHSAFAPMDLPSHPQ